MHVVRRHPRRWRNDGRIHDIDSNNLTGTLPSTLANLTNLRGLGLTRNYSLGGPIPAALATLANLEYLALSFNALTGSIPAALGSMPNSPVWR